MRTLILALALTLPSLSHAADPAALLGAANSLIQALEAAVETKTIYADYLPGYGLHLSTAYESDELTPEVQERYITTVSGILGGLAPTITGLEQKDFVSYALTLDDYDRETPSTYIIIRARPGEPTEVWIDGQKQGENGGD